MNLASHLELHALERPGHPLLRFEGRTWAYGELNRDPTRLASALAQTGIGRGDRVALYLPNQPEFLMAYFAVQKLGAITVSVSSALKTEEVRCLLEDSGARAVCTTGELVDRVPADCPALRHRVVAGGRGGAGFESWLAAGREDFVSECCGESDPAALLYSSGTTGTPKGVTLTQGNIGWNTERCSCRAGFRADDRPAVFLPLAHAYGQNFIMNSAVRAGATMVLFRRFAPEAVLGAVGPEGITMLFGVPTVFMTLLGMDLRGYDLRSLRYEMSAGAAMPEDVPRRWADQFGRTIYEGYGLTECSPLACYNDATAYRPGSVGRAVDRAEVKVVDGDGRELSPGRCGEIVIRGPGVMKGYWNRPADTEQALRNGWLHSGDIGRMDADGYVYVVGRKKEMINTAGFKVWPAEVENYLARMPGVRESAVFGLPDPKRGEQVAAAVVPQPGEQLTAEQVVLYCRARIASYKVPARVEIVPDLPRSAVGKVLKGVLRARITASLPINQE